MLGARQMARARLLQRSHVRVVLTASWGPARDRTRGLSHRVHRHRNGRPAQEETCGGERRAARLSYDLPGPISGRWFAAAVSDRMGVVLGVCVYHIAHQTLAWLVLDREPERRDAGLHAGALRRARTRDGAPSILGEGSSEWRGRRRREGSRREPRLGLARHRSFYALNGRSRDRRSDARDARCADHDPGRARPLAGATSDGRRGGLLSRRRTCPCTSP